MLSKLVISNFIIIESVELYFSIGLNVIIGETGAGKSIIVDALNILFGGKATTEYIRECSNKAIIEGNFFFDKKNHSDLFNFLNELDINCESNEIIIRREIPSKGNSRCFVNDNPVNIATLKKITAKIFDVHNQNEQQKILENEEQIKVIDNFLDDKEILSNYKETEYNLKQIIAEYNLSLSKRNNSIERQEVLTKLLNEITEIAPQIDEDIQITNELTILENAEELVLLIDNIKNILDNENYSTIAGLNEATKLLTKLTEIDDAFLQYKTEFDAAIIAIKETYKFANQYKDKIEFNPERIEALRNRFIELRKLIKKYGSINEALNKQAEYKKELTLFENFDKILAELKNKIEKYKEKISKLAIKLTAERTKAANILAIALTDELKKLGIENANIKFDFTLTELKNNNGIQPNIEKKLDNEVLYCNINGKKILLTAHGADNIEFLISMNKGENVGLVSEVASGGEISRIMLALKTILAAKDSTPILIFDEIDTGISGRIAQKVGKSMQNIAKYHQILLVTHLPQIAALGDNIIAIEKQELAERTIIIAKKLDEKGKITEIAKMLSGEIITEAAIKGAKELIEYKKI
jgi:DNA repair protein RecN (Recombination protein N)